MTSTQTDLQASAETRRKAIDMKLEVVVLPVSDVDRAKAFYGAFGWREDIDYTTGKQLRVVQFTPTGSGTSIIFGDGLTDAAPGSTQDLQLVVSDIEAARDDLARRGIDVTEVFHDSGGVFHHGGTAERLPGPDPERRSYASFLAFSDPDGNGWVVQEVTARAPDRTDPDRSAFVSVGDLASALRRAATAHGEHEARTGSADANWPDWYAEYMVSEQSGAGLPE